MKKISIILFYLFLVQLLHSCVEENMPSGGQFANSPYSLSVNRSSLTFSANENLTWVIYVTSKNTPWEITNIPSWLDVSPQSGKADATISVTASRNTDYGSERVAVLDFHSMAEEYTYVKAITVTQNRANANEARLNFVQKTASATVDADAEAAVMEFAWGSAHNKLNITEGADWCATVSDDWITLSSYSGNGGESITIYVQDNDSDDARTGTVMIATGEQLLRVSVVQQGRYLNINSTAGDVEAVGGNVIFAVGKSFGAEANVEYDGDRKDWVAVENDGEGNYTLRVAYNPSADSRTAQLVIDPVKGGAGSVCASGIKFKITQCGICK